jgi:hypothetical protein
MDSSSFSGTLQEEVYLNYSLKKTLRSEIQNSLTISGLPPHKLVLKVNCTFY